MQSLHSEIGKNQSNSDLPIPGITLSESWRSAFGKLSAGCLSDARAVILIGERGLGKASLIEAWRDQSAAAFNVLDLKNASGEPDQVVADLAALMGVDTADLGRSAILSAITNSVKATRAGGKETVVIVDEDNGIPGNTIELLMVLARDRGSNKPLLRYIISGSSKLRKTMRLDGGAARRQNYVTIELERFTPKQTKAFVTANLAQTSDITISDDAAAYLHESTSGRPANILTVLDKVQQGRIDAGEAEITRAHIQSLVKAPKSVDAAPTTTVTQAEPSVAKDAPPTEAPDMSVETSEKTKNESGNVFATNPDLPDSIRNVNDPRPLLRWAFGLDGHSETEALANRAEASVAAARAADGDRRQITSDIDLNEALAEVAKREKDAREREQAIPQIAEPKAPAPEVLRASKPGTDDNLERMIESEAFSFEERAAPTIALAQDPGDLNMALRQPPRPKASGGTNTLVFAAGIAVMGIAALGLLWTALQPNEIVNPLQDVTTQQTAATLEPPQRTSLDQPSVDETQAIAAALPDPQANPEIGAGEPDLSGVIARLKSPELAGQEADQAAVVTPFRDNAPQVASASSLAPAGADTAAEISGLRKSIVADISGEETRLMDQLASLEDQVSQKKDVLAGLEQAIDTMSAQTLERGSVLDSRNDEIEVVTSRLAFIARDRAQAVARLKQTTAQAQSAEEKLQLMRDELAAAETLIQENQTLLDQNQTTTLNLGEAVAKREAEYADLTRKVAETEEQLASRREDLAALVAKQQEARTDLAELEGKLADAQASQAEVSSDLEKLVADRTAQQAASEALNTDVMTADARLTQANAELQAANEALASRTATLAEIEAKTKTAQSDLAGLVAELDTRKTAVTSSSLEVTGLQSERETLEGQLAAVASQIEKANGQLEALEADQQTASSEFANLSTKREALRDELKLGEASLTRVNGELAIKERAVNALVAELNVGAAQIDAQRAELAALAAQSVDVEAAQSNAQATVNAEQSLVASASSDLAVLKSEQAVVAAALTDIQNRAAAAQSEFDAIEARRIAAETEIVTTLARLDDIKAQELLAQSGSAELSGDLDGKQTRLSELDQLILASNKELEEVVTKKTALNSQLAALTDEGTARLREQQAELDRISEVLAEKQAALASLTQELTIAEQTGSLQIPTRPAEAGIETSSLETVTVPAIRVRPTSSTQAPAVVEQVVTIDPAASATGIALTPRDVELVKEALAGAPGLGRAPQDQRDQLQAALTRGECVTDALKATFGRVNPHTLVALLKNMEMCGS